MGIETMMDRVEEFERDGKNFVYIDFSGLTATDDISQAIDRAKAVICSHQIRSVFTITNLDGLRFDNETKDLIIPYTEGNQPYVIAGAIIKLDDFKKSIAETVFAVSGRKELIIMDTKEEAIQFFISKF